jgi:hypothetical protein
MKMGEDWGAVWLLRLADFPINYDRAVESGIKQES